LEGVAIHYGWSRFRLLSPEAVADLNYRHAFQMDAGSRLQPGSLSCFHCVRPDWPAAEKMQAVTPNPHPSSPTKAKAATKHHHEGASSYLWFCFAVEVILTFGITQRMCWNTSTALVIACFGRRESSVGFCKVFVKHELARLAKPSYAAIHGNFLYVGITLIRTACGLETGHAIYRPRLLHSITLPHCSQDISKTRQLN